jgi:hypothetical protein
MRFPLIILCLLSCLTLLSHGEGLEFPKPALEEKASPGAATLVARYPFTNRSTRPMALKRFETECSCMTIETRDKKMRFEPGESGEIIASFQIGNYVGTVEKSIRVWLEDDGAAPSQTLKLKVIVPALVQIEAKTLTWAVGSTDGPKATRVSFEGEKPVRIIGISSSNPNFTPSFKAIEEGRSYEVSVACSSAANKVLGMIKVQTDSTIETQRGVQLFAVVK